MTDHRKKLFVLVSLTAWLMSAVAQASHPTHYWAVRGPGGAYGIVEFDEGVWEGDKVQPYPITTIHIGPVRYGVQAEAYAVLAGLLAIAISCSAGAVFLAQWFVDRRSRKESHAA